MSRKKKKDRDDYPAAPLPANSYVYDGDELRATAIYDPGSNAYISRTYQSAAEQQAKQQLQLQYNQLLSQLGKTSPEQAQNLDSYEQTLYQKTRKPLDEEYQRGNTQARESFNSSGFMNSTGFEDYRSQQLNKLYQEGLSQAALDARLAREQLATDYENQLIQKLNTLANNISGASARALNLNDSSRSNSSLLNQFASQNYVNQLEQLRMRRNNESQSNYPPFYQRLLSSYLSR